MSKITKDKSSSLKYHIDETSGFLTAPVSLARTGIQEYYGFELGLEDRSLDLINVYRSPEEIFDVASVESFVNLVATDDHPTAPVTTDNVKTLQVGQVSGVVASDDKKTLRGVLTITDAEVIKVISGGKREVSVGYTNKLVQQDGMYEGRKYEYIQTDIRANHLAIVTAGRCGSDCNISMDNKGRKSMKVTIGGIAFDTDNDQLVQAISNMVADHKTELDGVKADLTKAVAAKDTAEAKADTAIADAAKTIISDEALNTLVSDRAALLADALSILGSDKMPECTNCPFEIKSAVVDHINGLDLSGKSEDYINAAYDMALAQHKKGLENQDNLKKDFKKMDENNIAVDQARDNARSEYLKSKGLGE